MSDPMIKHEIDEDNWLEIYRTGNGYRVEKKDSKPVFNEEKYWYNTTSGEGLDFDSGRKRCSGGYRDITEKQSVTQTAEKLIREYNNSC